MCHTASPECNRVADDLTMTLRLYENDAMRPVQLIMGVDTNGDSTTSCLPGVTWPDIAIHDFSSGLYEGSITVNIVTETFPHDYGPSSAGSCQIVSMNN
jgi:hypothetical protein